MKFDHKFYNVPGILLSVSQKGGRVEHYCSGMLDVKAHVKMQADRLLACGQMTRLFTMSILLRLVDDGLLNLDVPLEAIANEYRRDRGLLRLIVSQYPILKPVTLRELLANTSGLPAFDKTLSYNQIFMRKPKKIWVLENYLDAISGTDVLYQRGYKPASRGYYCDSATDYVVASLIIGAVTGLEISEAMQNLFAEYDIRDTYYLPYGEVDKALKAKMLHGYLPVSHPLASAFGRLAQLTYNDNKELQALDVTGAYTLNGMGNAAVLSTSTDLITWFQQLIDCKIVINSYQQIFSPAPVVRRKTSNSTADHYCLGFYKTNYIKDNKNYGEILWSSGNLPGYETLIAHSLNKETTFILFVNISRQYTWLHSEGLVECVLNELFS